jgi:hypothetical protein
MEVQRRRGGRKRLREMLKKRFIWLVSDEFIMWKFLKEISLVEEEEDEREKEDERKE